MISSSNGKNHIKNKLEPEAMEFIRFFLLKISMHSKTSIHYPLEDFCLA